MVALGEQHNKAGKPLKHTCTYILILLLTKGKQVFCYDYIDILGRKEEQQLPEKDKYFNSLKKCGITQEECDIA